MTKFRFGALVVLAACALVLSACGLDFTKPSNDGGKKPAPVGGTTTNWYHPPDDPSAPAPGLPEIPECGKDYPLTIVYSRSANCADKYVTAGNLQVTGDQFQYAVKAATCTTGECPVADYKYTATYTECNAGVAKSIVTGTIFCAAKMGEHYGPTAALVPLRKVEVKDPSKIDLGTGYRAQVQYQVYTSTAASFELLACGTTGYYEYVYRERALAGCDLIPTYEPFVKKAELAALKAGASSVTCSYPCKKNSGIVRREWRCDVVANKASGEKDAWVTVTIDYSVGCSKNP
jgi:hypothetical protein